MGGVVPEGVGPGAWAGPFPPTWRILIPTLGQRRDSLERLLNVLLPQAEPYGGQVQVTALWNNGERSIGQVRQDLLSFSDSEYLCFVDDDDLVSSDYVQQIMGALEKKPHMVGFNTMIYSEGRRWKQAYINLDYGGFGKARDKVKGTTILVRDITHLCPIRTEIARQGSFGNVPRGGAEDMFWIEQMRGRVTTQEYINKVLYHYYYSRAGSSHVLKGGTWKAKGIDPGPHLQLKVDHPHFSYHPWRADA